MEKVILINATPANKNEPGPHPPLGLIYIAMRLKQNMPRTYIKILDGQILSFEEIKEEIKQIKPNFVGISLVFKNHNLALKLARTCKKAGAKVIMGGHYIGGLALETLKKRGRDSGDYCIDAIIRYDGEEAFSQYVCGVNPDLIGNLIYRRGNSIIANKTKPFPFSSNPFPSKSDFISPEQYFKEYQKRHPSSVFKRPFLISSQRGCSWRSATGGCIFCSLGYKDFRLRSPKDIWKEIDNLVYNHGVDYIWDASDNFLGNKSWFEGFYREYKKRRIKPLFKIYARSSDLCDEKNVKMLKDMNVSHIFIGFEGQDDDTLKNIKKGASSFHNERAFILLQKYKIAIRAFLVLGLLGETEESLMKTVKFGRRIYEGGNNNMLVITTLTPLPNSMAFDLLRQKMPNEYSGRDLIDWNEASRNWIKHFCSISVDAVMKNLKYLRSFSRDENAFNY